MALNVRDACVVPHDLVALVCSYLDMGPGGGQGHQPVEAISPAPEALLFFHPKTLTLAKRIQGRSLLEKYCEGAAEGGVATSAWSRQQPSQVASVFYLFNSLKQKTLY